METVDAGGSSDVRDVQDVSKMLWANDVIWREITSFLSITNLKDLSCVSKYLLERVRNLYRFTSLASQEIRGKMRIHVFKLSRAIVMLDKLNRSYLPRRARKVFQETEYLEIKDFDKLSNEERNFRLIQIVSNCQQLRSLKCESLKILKDDDGSFLRNEKVKERFANLKELEIGPSSINYKLRLEEMFGNFIIPGITPKVTYTLFKEMSRNMKLVKLTYYEPSIFRNCFHPFVLLSSSRDTLQELNITINFKKLASFNARTFPKLCKLELAVIRWYKGKYEIQLKRLRRTENFPEVVIPFLQNHLPNLTEFHFGGNYYFSLAPLCELLRQPRYTKKLKVLGFHSYNGFVQPLSEINWGFLKTILNLRDFAFNNRRKYRCYPNLWSVEDRECDDFGHFLAVLPSHLKSLDFRGLKFFGRHQDLLNTEISELLRFKNLTALKIHCCPFLTNELLQFICKHFTKLKIFEADFTDITLFGIAGVNPQENINTGISLSNLKDLVELEIISRINGLTIRVDEIVTAVCFSNLVKLTVQRGKECRVNKRFTAAQLLQLLSQNPSLEYIYLWKLAPARYIRTKVLQEHPRFKWHWE